MVKYEFKNEPVLTAISSYALIDALISLNETSYKEVLWVADLRRKDVKAAFSYRRESEDAEFEVTVSGRHFQDQALQIGDLIYLGDSDGPHYKNGIVRYEGYLKTKPSTWVVYKFSDL